ncbi:hypothetical protein [Botrimarina sp.]|uniref:hypothetical protein n=1 Tax=Botrimarina sp. TaxID=2795802 RepID=UPI0032EEE3DB
MPLTGNEKTVAKRRIMKLATTPILDLGFTLAAGGKTNGTFKLSDEEGNVLVVLLDVPTFDTFFRMAAHWKTPDGTVVGSGLYSLPFECPNHPGNRRYTFRFHRDSESQQRCAENIVDWFRDVAVDWFRNKTAGRWTNPSVIRT